MTPDQAKACLAVVAGFYPGRVPVSATVAKAWAWVLMDVDPRDCLLAIRELSLKSKWPPSVAEIRRHIEDKRSGIPTAEEAWAIISASVRDHPILDRYCLDLPPGTHEAVARAADSIPDRDLARGDAAARAHYMRIYEDQKERAYAESIDPLLAGKADGPRLGQMTRVSDILPGVIDPEDGPDDPMLGSGG